jgi:hypothetical protein
MYTVVSVAEDGTSYVVGLGVDLKAAKTLAKDADSPVIYDESGEPVGA